MAVAQSWVSNGLRVHFSLKFNFSDSLGSKMPSASSVLVQGEKKKRFRKVLEMYLDQYRRGTEVKSSSHEGDTKNGQAPTEAPKEKGLEPKEKVAFPFCPEALMPAKHMVYREGNTWCHCVLWGKQVTSVSRE